MPFDNTRVIPEDWSTHHAPVAAGGMNALCQIFDPAGYARGWDEGTEQSTIVRGAPAYDGPCRVQQLNQADGGEQAAQIDVTTHEYLVQLQYVTAHLEQGWDVVVTSAVNDADLVAWTAARPMVISDFQHGSERFTRDIVCTLNED